MSQYGHFEPRPNGGADWIPGGCGPGCTSVISLLFLVAVLAIVFSCCDVGGNKAPAIGDQKPRTETNAETITYESESSSLSGKAYQDLEKVPFHSLKVISTTNERLFGDQYYNDTVSSLFGEEFYGYYDLCSYGGTQPRESFVESLTNGEYRKFSGVVFADENMLEGDTIEFFVLADNDMIFQSGEMSRRTDPIHFDLDITGAKTVTIKSCSDDYHLMDTNPRIIAAELIVEK